jgi:hypothetical protein
VADSKITALTALTGTGIATSDVFVMVDVSDTTMDATGTDKKMTAAELAIAIATVKPPSRSLTDTHADTSAVNTTTETVVASQAVPTTVAAGDIVRMTAYGDSSNNSGGSVNYTLKAILGATTVLTSNANAIVTSANRRQWMAEIEMLVVATNDERVGAFAFHGAASASGWSLATNSSGVGRGTATEDLTAGKNLQLSVTMGTAGASIDFVCHESWLEVIKR